jgi:hypothetical protein
MRLNVTRLIGLFALTAATACSTLRETRMQPAADYAAANHVYVVPTPTPNLAGPDTVRTSSPDGSTVFICADGSVRDASQVAPGQKPACL